MNTEPGTPAAPNEETLTCKAYFEEQPDGTVLPVDPADMPHPNETPEPLAGATIQQDLTVADLPPHPEPHSHTWTEQEKRCILAWGAELVSTNAAALQAKDAEIARLKADAGTVAAILALDVGGRPGVHGQTMGADGAGQFAYVIRGTQEQADNWAREHIRQREKSGQQFFSCVLVFNEEGYGGPMLTEIDAAIRAQTGGGHE